MGARLQSDVSTGKAGKKGSQLNQTGTEVGPKPTPVVPDNSQFQGADFSGVASNPKGASLAQRGNRGGGPAMAGRPLAGHNAIDPNAVDAEASGAGILSGNHGPKRGPGRSTKPGDIDKLKTAGL